MIKEPLLFIFLSLLIVVSPLGPASAQSGEESAGKAAEQAGRLREALTHYVAALQSVPEGSADDRRLRETIIRLVQKLSSPPARPEEATRFSVRGEIAIKEAKNTADFGEAAKEFSKAVRVAPWWVDGYYNLAVAQEKVGQLNEAIRSLNLYLLAAPASSDTEKVKRQIYALEYRLERSQKDAISKSQDEERKRREEEARARDPARLAGEWICTEGKYCVVSKRAWLMKISGTSFEIWGNDNNQGWRVFFLGTIEGDDLIGSYMADVASWAGCRNQAMRMVGKVTYGGDRIELSYENVASMKGCAATATNPMRYVLDRK